MNHENVLLKTLTDLCANYRENGGRDGDPVRLRLRDVEALLRAVLDSMEREVALRAAAEPSVWQPMDSAPRDHTEILILFDSATVDVVRLCWWNDGSPEQNGGGRDDAAVGWWSYRHSVTQEKIEIGEPVGWLPMPAERKERR
jgi:hypothetical protein